MRFLTNAGFETALIFESNTCSRSLYNSVLHHFPVTSLYNHHIEGNLSLRQAPHTSVRWQQFNHPIDTKNFPHVDREIITDIEKVFGILLECLRKQTDKNITFGKWAESLNPDVTLSEIEVLKSHVESAQKRGIITLKRSRLGNDVYLMQLSPSYFTPGVLPSVSQNPLQKMLKFTSEFLTSSKTPSTILEARSAFIKQYKKEFQHGTKKSLLKKLFMDTLEKGKRDGILSVQNGLVLVKKSTKPPSIISNAKVKRPWDMHSLLPRLFPRLIKLFRF